VSEREAILLDLGNGHQIIVAGLSRARNGDLLGDAMLENGPLTYADRVCLNRPEGRRDWAAKAAAATGSSIGRDKLDHGLLRLLPQAQAAIQEPPRAVSRGTTLIDLLLAPETGLELWHDPDGRGWITVVREGGSEHLRIGSDPFRKWASKKYYDTTTRPPTANALKEALLVLEARAVYDAAEHRTFVRIAGDDGHIYIDLADEQRRIVDVDASGWRMVRVAPVRFHRPRGIHALPIPVTERNIETLRKFVNIPEDHDFVLYVATLLMAFRPSGPYPVLVLQGEQGSGKSTAARVFRALIDPNAAGLRAEPRGVQDLMIAGNNSWVVGFDNMTQISPWLSDALCRLSTGGGFGTRELYTDGEEVLFDVTRPVLLNGIDQLASRGDLLDRAVVIHLPAIEESRRQTETQFWQDFEAERPAILGVLLDAASAALRNAPDTHLADVPRMADFAVWVTAAEPALGWEPGTFLAAYEAARIRVAEIALEESPVTDALRKLTLSAARWEGTLTDLLDELAKLAGVRVACGKLWPSNGRALRSHLDRLSPNLRRIGIDVQFGRHTKQGNLVTVSRLPTRP
jgi:hypothetical protein